MEYTAKRSHELSCPYREFECHRCRKFSGSASLLISHFVSSHSLIVRQVDGKNATFIPKNNQKPEAGHWWCLYHFESHDFMLHITPSMNGQFLNLQLYTFSPSAVIATLSLRSSSGCTTYSYRSSPKSYHSLSSSGPPSIFTPFSFCFVLKLLIRKNR